MNYYYLIGNILRSRQAQSRKLSSPTGLNQDTTIVCSSVSQVVQRPQRAQTTSAKPGRGYDTDTAPGTSLRRSRHCSPPSPLWAYKPVKIALLELLSYMPTAVLFEVKISRFWSYTWYDPIDSNSPTSGSLWPSFAWRLSA